MTKENLVYLAAVRKDISDLQKKQDELYYLALNSAEVADIEELFDYMFNNGEVPEILWE